MMGTSCQMKKEITAREAIYGIPLSVQVVCGNGSGTFSTVIDVEKAKILASGYDSCGKITEAAAVIQSEINDKDNESIQMVGYYRGQVFMIDKIMVNGYSFNF